MNEARAAGIVQPIEVQAANFELVAEGAKPSLAPGSLDGTGCTLGAEGGCQDSHTTLTYQDGQVTAMISGSTSGGPATANADSVASATIFFLVEGPGASSKSVPLDFTAASVGAGAPMASGLNAIADVQVDWSGGQFTACAGSGPSVASCKGQGTSFSGTQKGFGNIGVLNDYEVIVTGNAGGLGSGQYSATLDPKIIVDPSFPDASAYSIVFSPNVGGSAGSAVPEPSTWAMMVLGFAGLGYVGWRASRRTVASAG
ncbi:MAG TPA: PEP-CTERM sorting domain-containing protein [Roseiarcus sp.]|nr:PEP-CTERM sorting domain-containing protein [Roseiarcus sp.]